MTRDPMRARTVVLRLEKELSRACEMAGELSPDHVLLRELNEAVTRARMLHRALARGNGMLSARDAATARTLASILTREDSRARRDGVLSGDPGGRALVSVLGGASSAADALERHVTSTRSAALAARQKQLREAARTKRETRTEQEPRTQQERRRGAVIPAAGRLITLAAWLLPPANQARYSEEYRSELWAIAHDGGSRRAQLLLALRLLVQTPMLHITLRAERRRHGSAG